VSNVVSKTALGVESVVPAGENAVEPVADNSAGSLVDDTG
jgi:hypothetical protein